MSLLDYLSCAGLFFTVRPPNALPECGCVRVHFHLTSHPNRRTILLPLGRVQGADVIYNEATFPALLSTLADARLCSETTVIYLATKVVRRHA